MKLREYLSHIPPTSTGVTKEIDLLKNEEVSISFSQDVTVNVEPVDHCIETTTKSEIKVEDVAAYILAKIEKTTTIKLQKLVYYCQAWSLVWDEKPLFKEKIEAWANGPAIPELFKMHKGMFEIDGSYPLGNSNKLSDIQKDTIDAVLKHYGNKSAQWLVELSHLEDPWKNSRKGIPDRANSAIEIKLEDIALYYGSL